jgi:hypothetical protein
MSKTSINDQLQAKRAGGKRPFSARSLLMAFAAQGAILALGLFVVVIGPVFREEPEFVAKKTIYLPQRELEHSMAVAEFQQAAAAPTMIDRLATASLMPNSLPNLPPTPQIDFQPADSENPMAMGDALLGQAGLMGSLRSVNSKSSNTSFFGIQDNARKVVVAFDISQSVKTKIERSGLSMAAIKEEARRMIDGLNANTLFGFVQHARNYDRFRDFLVPATVENKAAAIQWLETEFVTDGRSKPGWVRGSPNGIEHVLDGIFQLEPDVVFLLSDGDYYRGSGGNEKVPTRDIRNRINFWMEQLPEKVRLHFVGFEMKEEDRKNLGGLIRSTGGQLRVVNQ